MLYSIGYNIEVNINGFCFYCYCYPIACDFILFSNDTLFIMVSFPGINHMKCSSISTIVFYWVMC